MAAAHATSDTLLVGSIPLPSTEEVFMTVTNALPGRLRAIPDGETGERDTYVIWQRECFPKETRRLLPFAGGVELSESHPGFTVESVKPSRYDTAAIESYQKFLDFRNKGVIPHGVRFQVSLPVPFDSIQAFLRPEFHEKLGPAYEQHIRDAATRIVEVIPHEDLSIQWDLAMVPAALECEKGRLPEDLFKPTFHPLMEGFVQRISPLVDLIPESIPVGLHICYGDLYHKHWVQPEDSAVMVDLANNLVRGAKRSVQYIHMPVPKDRDDIAYFQPLKDLDIGDAKLYLGLIHALDEDGTKKRITVAKQVIPKFGVGTECGMGRTPREELESILRISQDVTVAA